MRLADAKIRDDSDVARPLRAFSAAMNTQPREGAVLSARQQMVFTRDEIFRGFTWFAVIVAAFLLARPYAGIVHDNILYVGQALARLNPDIYRGDGVFPLGCEG